MKKIMFSHVTHWMPIPPIAEEGGEKKNKPAAPGLKFLRTFAKKV